jgi:secreted trypsin-like serine protease
MPREQTATGLIHPPGALFFVLIALAGAVAIPAARAQGHAQVHGAPPRARATARRRNDPSARASVIDGEPAPPGSFPWMAFVVDIRGEKAGQCGGVVLAPNLVLTAGHCAVNMETGVTNEAAGYRVVTGNVDWADPERQVSQVSRVLVYPHMRIYGYSDNGWGDAALLVLSTPTTAPAIPLATPADAKLLRGGTHALIAGWGETAYEQKQPSEQLMWGNTVVRGPQWCRRHAFPFNAEKQTCAIDSPSFASGVCYGDSGGPLLAAGPSGQGLIDIGITSRLTRANCSTRGPNIFTRADLISPWVNRWIAALDPPPSSPPKREPGVPAMDNPMAEGDVFQTLAKTFGNSFKLRRESYAVGCGAIHSTKRICGVSWFSGANDYYGVVVVYLRKHGDGLWGAGYTIEWVNDHCYFHVKHKNSCTVHTRSHF